MFGLSGRFATLLGSVAGGPGGPDGGPVGGPFGPGGAVGGPLGGPLGGPDGPLGGVGGPLGGPLGGDGGPVGGVGGPLGGVGGPVGGVGGLLGGEGGVGGPLGGPLGGDGGPVGGVGGPLGGPLGGVGGPVGGVGGPGGPLGGPLGSTGAEFRGVSSDVGSATLSSVVDFGDSLTEGEDGACARSGSSLLEGCDIGASLTGFGFNIGASREFCPPVVVIPVDSKSMSALIRVSPPSEFSAAYEVSTTFVGSIISLSCTFPKSPRLWSKAPENNDDPIVLANFLPCVALYSKSKENGPILTSSFEPFSTKVHSPESSGNSKFQSL